MFKPLPPADETSRLETMRSYDFPTDLPDAGLDDLTALAAQICGTPISLVSLVGDQEQFFKSKVGTTLTRTARDISFCAQAILQSELFVVPDALQDERFANSPLVTGEPRIRFYAGAPLQSPEGHAIGALCVIDRTPRQLTPSQLEGLRVLGRQVMSVLELHRKARELAASQEQLNYAMDATLDGLWDWDIPSGSVHFSAQWARLLGYSVEEIPQRVEFFFTVLHPDDIPRIQQVLEDHLSGKTPVKQDEIRLRHKSGEFRWFLDRGKVVVRDANGKPLRMVGTITDITARKRAEAALQESERELRQSQKMEAIGQLAGGVAHDFNNILAAILGNAELAMTEVPRLHPAYENLAGIKAASARAKSLIQQILTFSRQQPQDRQVISLAPIVQETVRFLRATIPAMVELLCSIDDSTPPVVADPTQIHQVLANLVTNAWHALGDQLGCIEIKLKPVMVSAGSPERIEGLRPGLFACLSVRDTGKGMDATTLSRIFDPFFTTKQPGQGTGLGLSVVHGIVHDHDGSITVASQPGRGALFRVFLPAAINTEESVAAGSAEPIRGNGLRVLYVDDESSLVSLAKRMLERLGYQVDGFTSPHEATNVFRSAPERFDAVITDQNMPGMSGFQTASRILEIRPDIPVLLCSGRVTDELRHRARLAGIRDVLHKPNTIEELSQALHRATALVAVSDDKA
jgi:PAS domain S-box-containing protein